MFQPKLSNRRDLLIDLANHDGFKLLEERIQAEISTAISALTRASGLQDIGRWQGELATLEKMTTLREVMIAEINDAIEAETLPSAAVKAFDAFYGAGVKR